MTIPFLACMASVAAFYHLPPRVLPAEPGLIYFEVGRGSEEWQNVQRSMSLAVRLNEKGIEGTINGQTVLNVKTGSGRMSKMVFGLFVVKTDQK